MSRKAVLATISLPIDERSVQPGVNIERALKLIDELSPWKPDLVVLPEEIDVLFGIPYEESRKMGETVPGGPIQQKFKEAAVKCNTNLVLSIREREGKHVYNTSIVIDRQGRYIGKYRKTHLAPSEEVDVSPGDSYPVFELDFGTIGITVCMELHYPEIWTILALQGADVIVHPTAAIDYTGSLNESLINARAIDNQIYVVTSHYVKMPYLAGNPMGHSRIVDPYGRTRADTGHRPGVAVAAVDLDESYEYWATGETKKKYPTLKECFLGMRRPETYGILARPDSENKWKIKAPVLYNNGE
ncbi:carbon-nitrogen hydrolase family protein [Paenibacillus solisilvae]|uniref:Carbon-nitrogen hydrolase family protein n=1 Tax=Paenibacillus solisilvae TaxID=2486751 RepID=A0ABW0W967_9BACL